MPSKSANVKNEKQYEALKDKGMPKERAAKIANSPGASERGGKRGSGGDSSHRRDDGPKEEGRSQRRQGFEQKGLNSPSHRKPSVGASCCSAPS